MISFGLVPLIASRGVLSSFDRPVGSHQIEGTGRPFCLPGSALAATPFPGSGPQWHGQHVGRGVPPLNHFLRGLSHLAEGYEDHHRITASTDVPDRNLAGCNEASWFVTVFPWAKIAAQSR